MDVELGIICLARPKPKRLYQLADTGLLPRRCVPSSREVSALPSDSISTSLFNQNKQVFRPPKSSNE